MSEAAKPMRYVGRLSEAMQSPQGTYCKCSDCRLLFLDDWAFFGTVQCPVCKQAALQRGISLDQAAEMQSTDEQQHALLPNTT